MVLAQLLNMLVAVTVVQAAIPALLSRRWLLLARPR
jgi:hypothetical protein